MAVKTVKTKKTTEETPVEETGIVESAPTAARLKTVTKTDPFASLFKLFSDLQSEFELLQKEIAQTRQNWAAEQKAHLREIEQRNSLEELERKRNKETYEYETARKYKLAEDEFADKKTNWEKELKNQQEVLEKEKAELLELRKLAAGFVAEKEKSVSQAQEILRQELTAEFETERKLKDQEQKAEKDILNLKITNLTSENNRLNSEIANLKRALEEATKQVKEIAVKVIESGTKPQVSEIVSG